MACVSAADHDPAAPDRGGVLVPRGAFTALSRGSLEFRNVLIAECCYSGVQMLMACNGKVDALATRVLNQLGIELPRRACRNAARDLALVGLAPDRWLATFQGESGVRMVSLRQAVEGFASVVEQADAFAMLRIEGSGTRETLGNLVALDLHPRSFLVGDVATTLADYTSATLWRLEDRCDGAPAFEILVPRSYAESFWSALIDAIA